ncbi:hypothetical protein [Ornithinibacillus xuwenensis]|uniref:DUF4129 domain-containing protein n=1 Tax=Ornithinibacillus xuwenensis TaxID=3144668 RepID=A0ABU9XJC7_9BACI
MQHNHPLIAYAYHFFSEAILLFLIALPILHHRFFFEPYGSYLMVVIGASILYTTLTKLTDNIYVYIMVTPILFVAFHLLDYPIIFSVLFSILLTWRYINIRNQETVKRESIYILMTIILTIFVSILVHDSQIMLYPFLQFSILFIGFVFSHFIYVSKQDRKRIDYKIPVYFVGILSVGAFLFFILFEGFRTVTVTLWKGLLDGASGALIGISNMLSFLEVEQRGWPEQDNSDGHEFNPENAGQVIEEPSIVDQLTGLLVLGVTAVLLCAIIIILLWVVKKRIVKRLSGVEQRDEVTINVTEVSLETPRENRSIFGIKRFFKPPEHPIRKMLLQFERKANKKQKGRKPFETVEDWFNRIGLNANIEIYQRVRYGELNVSDDEKNTLKEQLKKMEEIITAN